MTVHTGMFGGKASFVPLAKAGMQGKGIAATNVPLMQGRMFSYQDTQITRLGGPNWAQLPINRAHTSINDGARDGMHQSALHTGDAAYVPNTLDGDLPLVSSAAEGGYVETPQIVEGTIGRAAPASFDDHFSHATLFFQSLTPLEQAHVVEAYAFELSKLLTGYPSQCTWP